MNLVVSTLIITVEIEEKYKTIDKCCGFYATRSLSPSKLRRNAKPDKNHGVSMRHAHYQPSKPERNTKPDKNLLISTQHTQYENHKKMT